MAAWVCLIVDDAVATRSCLMDILRENGIPSLEAGTPADAQRTIERLGGQVDLLFVEIDTAEGLEFARWVRSSFPAILLIGMSGAVEQAPAGFPVVRKPFEKDAVLKAIASASPRSSAAPGFRLPHVS
jgi:two-component SAPR family response regulator